MIDQHNPHAKAFRMAKDRLDSDNIAEVRLKLISTRGSDGRKTNIPTISEVAALIVGDMESVSNHRDIILHKHAGGLQPINELHASYLSLQYPLLFPYGEDGYRIDIQLSDVGNTASRKRVRVSMRAFFAFRIHERNREAKTLFLSRKLFQQFLVDVYTMIESDRLNYHRTHQKTVRAHLYKKLTKAANEGNTDPSSTGKRIVLPSSFTGGPRYMMENYQDAMAVSKFYGYPHLFITFTCNQKWPEISRFVEQRGLTSADRLDIVCRVFKIKLDDMISAIRSGELFGEVRALIYTIEFQMRGLPHAHIIVFLNRGNKIHAEEIDKIIYAEIPDPITDPDLFDVVTDLMIHGPCGSLNTKSPCMHDGKCNKKFPKRYIEATTIDDNGFPVYKRRRNGHTVKKNGIDIDNRFVVPYNKSLMLRYRAHINVEWCNQLGAVKYLFKYVNKGHDRVTATISNTSGYNQEGYGVDEIKDYYNCKFPPVLRFNFHLEGEQNVIFDDEDSIDDVLDKPGVDQSMFTKWMEFNKTSSKGKDLRYYEFPTKFVWNKQAKKWTERDSETSISIGRIYNVSPGSGERYYLRILLNLVKGPTSYDDIRTVNGKTYHTFREACYALGLLDDEREYIDGIIESSFWASGHYLGKLFAMLLTSGSMCRPEFVWTHTWKYLSDDILASRRRILQIDDLRLDEDQLQNQTLAEIEKLLQRNGDTLKNYPSMPFPDDGIILDGLNKLIQDELRYDRQALTIEHQKLYSQFTDEQKGVYDEIMSAVNSNNGGVFFLYGYGGTGKTFIWRSLSAVIRSKGDIVLNVASSGIASLLLPGGRTAHSRFAIPIHLHEESTCHIMPGTELAELISKAKLIIWDEAPMVNKFAFEALDRTLRDIVRSSSIDNSQLPFGGKVVVFGGDFRQILPVVPNGTREDIVSSTLIFSYLWNHCKVLRLTRNMRLQHGCTPTEIEEVRQFSEWILKVGDGNEDDPDCGETFIEFPSDVLITETTNPVQTIVETTYPSLLDIENPAEYFHQRVILAPTHQVVDQVNDHILSLLPGEEKVYLSSDSLCKTEENYANDVNVYSIDYLNTIQCSGVPNHVLKLKIGVPVMLLRNIDQSLGLCNGTRLLVCRLGDHVIEAQIISGRHIGERVFIPHMLLTPSDTRYSFKFQRRQFPLMVCFAMTINKSQGQSLSQVGLFLPRPVFTHGQLYVALSRVTSKKGLKVLICDRENKPQNTTINVVYKEVFSKLDMTD